MYLLKLCLSKDFFFFLTKKAFKGQPGNFCKNTGHFYENNRHSKNLIFFDKFKLLLTLILNF